jgi:hypothetical protein
MYVKNFDVPYWTPEAKVPIRKIKIDRKRLAFDNPVEAAQVSWIVANFDRELWIPIIVDKDYYLVDGQHRLAVARKLGLQYIDVVIEDGDLLKPKEHQPRRGRHIMRAHGEPHRIAAYCSTT